MSGTGARVYTAHSGWLGVVTGISAASTGGVLVLNNSPSLASRPGRQHHRPASHAHRQQPCVTITCGLRID